ncbi:MAG: hypothetical protein RL026_1473 [Pseudomonadota bacterium]|jgi:two-component system C4-dicarboxylate transport sensor histidine kinase DctB
MSLSLSWCLRGAVTLLAVGAVTSVSGSLASHLAWQRQTEQLQHDLVLKRELLHSELERHRLLPSALAGDPQLAAAVRVPGSGQAYLEAQPVLAALSRRLESLAREDGSASLYLIRSDGVTVAASNHSTAASFVGNKYSFRPYFTQAMRSGTGQYFAQGTVSGVAGLYLSTRLLGGDGVVVVKVEFTALERTWRRADERVFVVDRSGTVLLASEPHLRFRVLPAVSSETVARRERPASQPDWTMVLERDLSTALWSARVGGMLAGGLAATLLAIMLWAGLLLRQQRARIRQRLEELVDARTTELRLINERLVTESEQRALADQRLARLRSDLVNINRLAVLGQVSAGVAHEINQPLAAIRGYVDNARIFLARDDTAAVTGNLAEVARLTERIALITQELRLLARKAPAVAEHVAVDEAIEGAKLLVDTVLRSHRIRVVREPASCRVRVVANRVRLEQVLVNLLQNAMEAMEDGKGGTIVVGCTREASRVRIAVRDDGPGVAEDVLSGLFTPFNTSKPLGLGMGLVICRDLLAEFGGTLSHEPNLPRGANFIIELPEATEAH